MKPLLAQAFSDRWTVVAQILGWPVLITLLYNWLAIPEAKALQLGLSLVLALILLTLLTWLVALAFTSGTPRLGAALRRVPRIAPLVLIWSALLVYTMYALDHESWRWIALAVLLVIFAPLCAGGLRGFERLRQGPVWLGLAWFMLIGLYLPWKLIWWVPKLEGLTGQGASAAARFIAAGVLFAVAWLVMGSALAVNDPGRQASSEDPAPAAAG